MFSRVSSPGSPSSILPPSGHTEWCPFGQLPTPNCPSRCKCECGCLFAQRPLRQTGDSPTPRQLGRTPVTATLSPGAAVMEAGMESRVSLWPISSKPVLIHPKMQQAGCFDILARVFPFHGNNCASEHLIPPWRFCKEFFLQCHLSFGAPRFRRACWTSDAAGHPETSFGLSFFWLVIDFFINQWACNYDTTLFRQTVAVFSAQVLFSSSSAPIKQFELESVVMLAFRPSYQQTLVTTLLSARQLTSSLWGFRRDAATRWQYDTEKRG